MSLHDRISRARVSVPRNLTILGVRVSFLKSVFPILFTWKHNANAKVFRLLTHRIALSISNKRTAWPR